MIKLFFLFLILFHFIIHINNYIVLPIYTLKNVNYKSLSYTKNSPEDIIVSEYRSSFYTELEIGNPPQKIPLLIKVKTNDYVITSIHPIEKSVTYENKTVYDFSDNFLKNYDFFNENKSNTISYKYFRNRKKNKNSDDIPIADEMAPAYDSFYLYQNINMKNKVEINNLYFDLVRNIRDNVTGIIGLGLYDIYYRTTSSFLHILKNNNLTNSHFWFFEFDSPKSDKGKLVIGSLLDEIYEDQYDREDISYAKTNQGYLYYNMDFNKIFIDNLSEITDLGKATCELNYDNNVIVASYEYKKYFKSLLNDSIAEQICLESTFEAKNDLYSSKSNFIFYYCKNEQSIKDELKKLIKPIKFYSSEFNYTFEITHDDILKEVNEYIYIKIIFEKYGGTWILGKPFSLKYKFIFNPELKEIAFYHKFKDKPESQTFTIILKIILILLLIVILVFLGVLLGKKIYGLKRKKRANELNDDFEYFSEDKKEKDKENTIN